MPSFPNPKVGRFGDISFPVRSCSARFALKEHVHKYIHTKGGDAELMKRDPYEITMTIPFIDGFKSYPNLFTSGVGKFRALAEEQERLPLTVPALGTFKAAYAFEFAQDYEAKLTNGVLVNVRFREDNSEDFTPAKLVAVAAANLTQGLASLEGLAPNPSPFILDSIFAAARELQGLRDGALLELAFYLGKVDALLSLLDEADRTLDTLKDPAEAELIDAFKNLWDSTIATGESILEINDVRTFVTPRRMTCGEIGAQVYGSAARGGELLQLNALDDPFNVPAGFTIRYIG